ncbi:MAG: CehA/McbA family metallohydrolase [Planctomycetota bacterium]
MKVLRALNLTVFVAALCFLSRAEARAAESGVLELSVVDASTGRPVPARVRIRDHTGADHVPAAAGVVPIARDKWFPAAGPVRMRLPAGMVSIRVERGLEYEPVKESVTLRAGETVEHRVELVRWINLRERGYVSGENHIHVAAEKLGAMLAAEDLNFGTSLHWWNGPRFEQQSHGNWRDDLKTDGHTIATSVFDAEVEYPWGAVYLVGLKEPVSIAADAGRSNLPFVKAAHAQGALVCYQAGWSREVLPDALLGYVDVVNVCNNNFQRHRFQPRRRYSNLLNVEGFPDYPETAEGMLRINCETYYRLLNCGLRLAAGAGSAIGAKSTPCGYNRAYVRAGDDPSLAEFLDAWRQGRNFVTNPMIFLSTKDGRKPGDTIDMPPEGAMVTFRVEARSDQSLRLVEIVANGKVVARSDLTGSQREHALTCSFHVDEGTWVAARCTDEDRLLSDRQLGRYVQGTAGNFPCEPTRLRFAHTSPVYITVGGKSPRVEASVNEARKMLAAFKRFARKQADEKYLAEILDPLPSDIP